MKTIQFTKLPEPLNLLQTPVKDLEFSQMIEIQVNQKVTYEGGVFIFASMPKEVLNFCRMTILTAPTSINSRLAAKNKKVAGQKPQRSNDVTFGYKPSRPVFGHTAGAVRYTVEHPQEFKVLTILGEILEALCETYVGELFLEHSLRAKKNIKAEYLIGKTSFTQGVVNRSNPLHYHFDRGNYKDSYSAMVWVVEGDVEGGELVLPSLNAFVRPCDGGVIIFKGQNIIHGVAPVFRKKPNSERMSVVFYTNEALEKAEDSQEELKKSKLREYRKHFK